MKKWEIFLKINVRIKKNPLILKLATTHTNFCNWCKVIRVKESTRQRQTFHFIWNMLIKKVVIETIAAIMIKNRNNNKEIRRKLRILASTISNIHMSTHLWTWRPKALIQRGKQSRSCTSLDPCQGRRWLSWFAKCLHAEYRDHTRSVPGREYRWQHNTVEPLIKFIEESNPNQPREIISKIIIHTKGSSHMSFYF